MRLRGIPTSSSRNLIYLDSFEWNVVYLGFYRIIHFILVNDFGTRIFHTIDISKTKLNIFEKNDEFVRIFEQR